MDLQVRKINQKKRPKMIVEEIISLIATGRLKSGDQLPPERVLSEEFGVSRATLREGLVSLEIMGIITMRTGGGSYVTELDMIPFLRMMSQLMTRNDDLFNDLIDMRVLFELQAVRLIIQTNSAKAKVLGDIVSEMEKSFFAADTEKSLEEDIKFHKALYELSGNRVLEMTGEAISTVLASSVRSNRAKILRVNDLELLYNQHNLIYKSILQGEEEIAARILTKHLNLAKEIEVI